MAGVASLNFDSAVVLGLLVCIGYHFKYSILESSLDGIRFYALWKRDLSAEMSITPFSTIDTFGPLFVFLLPLSLDDHCIVRDIDFNVVFGHSRQIRADYKLSVAFENIHFR